MADVLYYSRNVKVYLELDTGEFWEIPVLDGFSFSQATNASEITLNEAADSAGNSRRAKQVFNDSFAPAEWSFSTYVRPFISAGGAATGIADDSANHHAVEEALWACMFGSASQAYTAPVAATSDAAWGEVLTIDTSNMDISFAASNKTVLRTFSLYFHLQDGTAAETEDTWYKITNAVVNEATIDFDIEGIATIQFSGFGSLIDDVSAPTVSGAVTEGTTATNNYIRNRLSTVTMDGSGMGGSYQASYDIILTGGSITFSNNIEYLTPETLGSVNQPLGHVTGPRTVSGNFTCYLGTSTSATDEPVDLFEDIQSDTTRITSVWDLDFSIGGASAPNLAISVPQAHFELPDVNVEEVLMLEVNFHGLPTTIDATDEATMIYTGVALA